MQVATCSVVLPHFQFGSPLGAVIGSSVTARGTVTVAVTEVAGAVPVFVTENSIGFETPTTRPAVSYGRKARRDATIRSVVDA